MAKQEKTFEESLNELEKVASEIEKGDLTLEQAIAEFEKGIQLSKECSEKLDQAEKRINMLVQGENDTMEEVPFTAEQN